MIPVAISSAAERDLDDIELWIIENWGPVAAANAVERINDKIALLAESPLIGPPRPEFGEDVRLMPAGRYVIYYEARETLLVLRILHAARDRDAIMRDESD